jgi:hypothetical protein
LKREPLRRLVQLTKRAISPSDTGRRFDAAGTHCSTRQWLDA